ncbi:MAG: hypothetical protein IKH78_00710 [Ruminococcus sp.]|nr:hypothetical protein [Ruminococcus sp.]
MKKTTLPFILCGIICCVLYSGLFILGDYTVFVKRIRDADQLLYLLPLMCFALPFALYPLEKRFAGGSKGRAAAFFWTAVGGCAAGTVIAVKWLALTYIDVSSLSNPSEQRWVSGTRYLMLLLMIGGILWTLAYRGIIALINWFRMGY